MAKALDAIHNEEENPTSSSRTSIRMMSAQPSTVHWAVRMNHRNRVACSAVLAVVVLAQLMDRNAPVLAMVAAIAWFGLYPQALYAVSRHAPEPMRVETRNMRLDALMLGAWIGLLHFPLWVGVALVISATLHPVIFHGNRGFFESAGLLVAGSVGAAVVTGGQVDLSTSLPVTGLSLAYLGYYLVILTRDAYRSASTAVQLRRELRESQRSLSSRLEEIERLQAELREQALRDPLTGLYNRRHLDAQLPELLAQAGRQAEPLSVMMLDLDHFKQVNDLHGHQAGDEVLRHAARQITLHTRSSDLVCRYGGEEFVVVLPGVAPAQAAERAEALRAALELAPARFGALALPLTASFGVAGLTEEANHPDRLIGAADRALYEAKAQGRNRVVMAHVAHQGEPQTPSA